MGTNTAAVTKLALAVLLLLAPAAAPFANGTARGEERGRLALPAVEKLAGTYASLYSQTLLAWTEQGWKPASADAGRLAGGRYKNASANVFVRSDALQGKPGAAQLKQPKDWIEYEFDVPQDGLYEIELTALPTEGSFSPVQIGVKIDGDYPFFEAKNIQLPRKWQDSAYPPAVNEHGDQIRPSQREIAEWSVATLTDAKHSNPDPLRWKLSKGKHTIRLESVMEPFALAEIAVKAPRPAPSYDEVAAGWKSLPNGAEPGWTTVVEAENMSAKSDPSVQVQASNDNLAAPESNGKQIYNTMGGFRWSRGGQSAEWTFDVPNDGFYYIHFKYLQNFTKDVISFREIRLDGEVPFRELQSYPFPYSRKWSVEPLKDGDGKPFALYLKKGTHRLGLTADPSPTTPVRESLQSIVDGYQDINRQVAMVTGVKNRSMVDQNRDWNLTETMPGAAGQLNGLADRLQGQVDKLQALYGNSLQGAEGLRSVIYDLRSMAAEPDLLSKRPPELHAQNIEKMTMFIDSLGRQPLTLDRIYVSASPERPASPPGTMAVVADMIGNFFRTFSPNYHYYGRRDPDGIDVWVNRGRDYVALMQQLADESFTAKTGVKVNVNLMPNPGQLILSNSAGREPDLALGIAEGTPVDFAMRNSLVKLSGFPDYADVAKRFQPGTLIPFTYDGDVYALPETVALSVLFYRTDILQSIGLKPPDTWDDLYKMLPTLQQKGYEFYFSKLNYGPIFMQNGASFYTEDGLQSGLNSREAFNAFKQWTELFTVYGFPTEVPSFYMHFRSGDMPIGIADYNAYMQLLVAAPELAGSWEISPIPGMRQKDGTVARWSGGNLTSGMIFRSSERQDDAWAFLKWWTSSETQARFGTEIELLNGVEFRWNTANVEAFRKLPWPEKDGKAILDQWKWYKEMPNVPGGYFTPRELSFAWTRTVLQNQNYREMLEKAVFQIDSELKRKQREFGFVDENGVTVRKLRVPDLKRPWEGEDDR
ncbi:extracellular solute-binding protein [Paenibacillus flagellatus]|uniref:ABC transporter substrate-binding protein n=1 Tax=Paenibacillus flagellatus TaxID=2211139 RepID=A0A2V5KBF1_9BACL|nr:extracellular solute-binding protein [Paenibacillus flagellatus]PYI55434.1 ABC transporter substrate-binding protein [Paenibacillus flagellatus]